MKCYKRRVDSIFIHSILSSPIVIEEKHSEFQIEGFKQNPHPSFHGYLATLASVSPSLADIIGTLVGSFPSDYS